MLYSPWFESPAHSSRPNFTFSAQRLLLHQLHKHDADYSTSRAWKPTNIREMQIYQDWDWGLKDPKISPGMGESLVFVRGFSTLKVKNLIICGFYTKHWPTYLERTTGVKAANPQIQTRVMGYVNGWERALTMYQLKFEELSSSS
jgi:hypothetical protein